MKKIILVICMVLVFSQMSVFADVNDSKVNSLSNNQFKEVEKLELTEAGDEIDFKIEYEGETINLESAPEIKDGILMVPIREILEELGYDIEWNEKTQMVDIKKGAHFTSIKVDENKYIKNKMAAFQLSSAPKLINEKTMVPVEFFYEILALDFKFEDNKIVFSKIENEKKLGLISEKGYITKIAVNDGRKRIYLSDKKDGEVSVVVNMSDENSIFQKEVKVGEKVSVLTFPIRTMSLPAQASGILVY